MFPSCFYFNLFFQFKILSILSQNQSPVLQETSMILDMIPCIDYFIYMEDIFIYIDHIFIYMDDFL